MVVLQMSAFFSGYDQFSGKQLSYKMTLFMEDCPCRDHATLEGIHGGPTPLSFRLKQKSLQFAGHCYWADKEIISSLILWRPLVRVHSRELPYPGVIARDLGLDMRDLSTAMVNRGVWEEIPMNVPSTPVVEG